MSDAEFLLTAEEIEDIISALPKHACPEKVTEIFGLICGIYDIPIHVAIEIGIDILQKLYNVLDCESKGQTIH